MAEKVEVVIKIPKYYLTHPQDYSCLAECVRRGVLLPKGHGRIMDVDKVIKKMEEREEKLKDDRSMWETAGVETALDMFGETIIEEDKAESEDDVNALKAVPTAEERKAGTWKEFHGNKNMCICQSCGFMVNKSLLYDYTEKDPLVFKYCPSCGSYNGGAKRR